MDQMTSIEQHILAAMLATRTTYDLFKRVGSLNDFSPIGRTVAGAISEYYDYDKDAQSASRELVECKLVGAIQNPKHRGPLVEYLRGLPGDVSGLNVRRELTESHRRAVGRTLSASLVNGAPQGDIDKLVAEYNRAQTDDLEAGGPVDDLVDVFDTSDLLAETQDLGDRIKLWPKPLNERCGRGALRGHHILVYGRPEIGKTAFVANLDAGFLHQRLNVLYIGNEEPVIDLKERHRARLLKIPRDDLYKDPKGIAARLEKADLGSLMLKESRSFAEVRYVLKFFKADVVVFDQIRNMKVTADSKNAQLEVAANEARNIGKEYNALIISVTQAGDSASGKVFLDMNDVDNSKTGIPGAVDLMIGVGADPAMKLNGLLGLSLPKNKLGGIHDRITVRVDFASGVIE